MAVDALSKTRIQRPKTPEEFQTMNEYIYDEKNREFYSDGDLIRRLQEVVALLSKVVRKDKRDLFGLYVADVFSWYNANANRHGLDVQEIMWARFPGVCSYCMQFSKCLCGMNHPEEEPEEKAKRLRAFLIDREGREPQTLAGHQDFHRTLYLWHHEGEDPVRIVQHIGEEVAEVSEALRHKDMENVAKEMADVLSWILTFCNRMDIDLEGVMWRIYPYECRKCEKAPCVCEEMV